MIAELADVRVFVSDVTRVHERDVVQLIADAHYTYRVEWIAFTPEQLGDEFFDLRTGLAGAITQKFVSYRIGLAVVGDIASRIAQSKPLADWVRESNRGQNLLFVRDLDELTARLQDGQ